MNLTNFTQNHSTIDITDIRNGHENRIKHSLKQKKKMILKVNKRVSKKEVKGEDTHD